MANSLEQLLITIITDGVEFDTPVFSWEVEKLGEGLCGKKIRVPVIRPKIWNITAVLFGASDGLMSSTKGIGFTFNCIATN